MKTLKKNINKWDLILVTAFLSIAAISFIGYRIIHQAPAVTVEISSFGREFDSSFFGVLIQILYLSHLRLIFLSNFVIFIVLLCTLCSIIKKTDFIIGEKRYVYIYHWK